LGLSALMLNGARSRLSELLRSEMTVPSAIARTLSAGLPRCYYLFISEY
jgi:hypothetical protein